MPDPLPLWQRRFRAPIVGFPMWSAHAPDRLVYASSESGIYQLHAWDLGTGERRQITSEPVGLIAGEITPDGEWVVWHRDTTGDESGVWVAAPFAGGTAEPFVEGLPEAWDQGISIGRQRIAAATSDREGFDLFISEGAGPARRLLHSDESIVLGGSNALMAGSGQGALSADETLICIEHSEHGDLIHPSLRILDAKTGAVVADLRDEGLAMCAFAWSPIPGDQRIAIGHERRGERAPAIWNVETGELQDLTLPWDRLTEVADWWPDASSVLLFELRDGRNHLHRYELATGAIEPIAMQEGSLTGARVRPDGAVWYRLQRGEHPGIVFESGRDEPILAAPIDAPPGRPFIPWEYPNEHGQRVSGWIVEPAGQKPWPTLFFIHGGPTSVDLDRWTPEVQAYVDMGFCVAMLNYRGSIGFGAAWRDELVGNIGWPEVADIVAGHDDLLSRGIADPTRSVIAGWSWGGYLTLLMHGMHPNRFIAGVAGVPVADYVAAYADESPLLQAYDRALLGGTAEEVPELMKERSPIEYVDQVRAPLLLLAGRNDSRCPLPQILNYVERLKARNHPHELYLFGTGHSSFDIDEKIRQLGVVLDYLSKTVPGITRLAGVRGDPDPELATAEIQPELV
ncbi:MAG TPA: prolyl oligopeptidase family serine peptidase [Candidatus Limnocylindria bacterium]|nr:prolyl oligopeptidase family serine peptidase [Candidatus Limnocylindria bacterium]